jgi:adenylate cyclase class IV
LKVSINTIKKQSERKTDQYKEITEEEEIREMLDIPVQDSFEQDLAAHGYIPYGSWVTIRTEYTKDGFVIDFDDVDFGLNMVEIELLVPDESAVLEANEKIVAFAKQHNLMFTPIAGKNTEYLRRFKPEHYQALVVTGIV